MSRVTAIVLAAGTGSRMKTDMPKQFLKLGDREVIAYSLEVFQEHQSITDIILVTGREYVEYCKCEIVDRYGLDKVTEVICGGAQRYDSVYAGLKCCGMGNDDIVMIHDGARPFVTEKMITASIECIRNGKVGCTVAVPSKDTVKLACEINGVLTGNETPDRKNVYLIQTPQTFRTSELMKAYEKMYNSPNHNITDDTMLLEQYMGVKSVLVEGTYENIKLTTPEDLLIAEIFAEKKLKKLKKMC